MPETLRPRARRRQEVTADPSNEMLSRVRRIETRLTQTMIALGVSTEAQRPVFDHGVITLPSRHCSVKEILDIIPDTWDGPVGVLIGDDRVATIHKA